jgi:CO/xanthine dehydrogenase FAD-binding subunit
MTSLADAGANQTVCDRLPGLPQALKSIGAPTLQQRVGTVGGNLCADTRCLYYNQSAFWRSGVAPCFKLGGEVCHPGGATADRCRSICQSDGAVMLAALEARVTLAAGSGERELGLEEFFTGRGEEPIAIEPADLLVNVKVPMPKGLGSAYYKVAARKAIDYPLISAAAAVCLDADGVVTKASLALGGVYAAPLLLKDATQSMVGQKCGPNEVATIARKAGSHAQPFFIENQSAPAEWRAEMAPVVAKRALTEALAAAKGKI